jgi:hypothetical protein
MTPGPHLQAVDRVSSRKESKGRPAVLRDKRIWYIVGGVIVVLILAYLFGIFDAADTPTAAPTRP